MALSIPKNGKILTIDKDKSKQQIARNFLYQANVSNKVKMLTGNALLLLKETFNKKEKFDLIFIDADKENYIKYFDYSVNMITKNGLIVIDNTLWKGKVMDSSDKTNGTRSIRELNDYIATDKNVSHCLLTLYDGMTLCIKK